MTQRQRKPFVRVTQEQILQFDARKPETFTHSSLVNAVLEAFGECGSLTMNDVSRYLDIPAEKLSTAIEVLTGSKFTAIRDLWARKEIDRLRTEHPKWTLDQIARHLGYADRTALWRMFHRDVRKKLYREMHY